MQSIPGERTDMNSAKSIDISNMPVRGTRPELRAA